MKREKDQKAKSSSGIKILNDERIALPSVSSKSALVMTSVPLSPPKQITLSIAKPKRETKLKQKKMDHYVLQTIKGEKIAGAEGEDCEDTIDFVLAGDDDPISTKPSGEIREVLHLTDEEDDNNEQEDVSSVAGTQEIVEHVCGKCYKTFRRLKSLKKHIDYCKFDSSYHLRKAEMIKNLDKIEKDAVVMDNKDVCFCCGESYDTYHLGHINCPDCPKSFKTQMSYERHIFISHSELNDHPCSICNAKLRSANLLKLHEDQHKNRGKPYACKICGKDFTRSYHLSRHQNRSSCSANENDTIHCKVCNKAFYRLDNLRAHLKQHLGNQVLKKSEYMCPICNKCFYSLSTLNIHTRTHTGERPFDCDLCEKKFPSLVALKKHRRYHTGEKPYTCSVCKQSFAVKEVLNRHMKRHTGDRPHVCTECGKRFIQGTQLRTHLKTHLRPHECSQCPEKFKTAKQLEKHVHKDHLRTNAKKGRVKCEHKCSICKTGFKTEFEYNAHMEAGQHITPQKKRKLRNRTDCAVCKADFGSVQSLQFHILKVHQEDPENFVNEDPLGRSTNDDETFTSSDYDAILMPPPKAIKMEAQSIEFITTNSEGRVLSSSIEKLNNSDTILQTNNKMDAPNKVQILEEFILNDFPPIGTAASTSSGAAKPNNSPNMAEGGRQTIILSNEAYTVIPLESDGGVIEPITTNSLLSVPSTTTFTSPENKKGIRKSLAASLAAAIADNEELEDISEEDEFSEEDLKLKENVYKLLDMLVDATTLKKFGWPEASEETVLCKVIENCGHDLSKEQSNYQNWDFSTRMREYVKLLFTVVIHNDSIKELLNNYPIDEVIEYVLGNDDDDDDDAAAEDSNNGHAKVQQTGEKTKAETDNNDIKNTIKDENE